MGNKTANITFVYRTLASARTPAFILGSMALFVLAGAASRHGAAQQGIMDGERLVFLSLGADLRSLFSSPLFAAMSMALLASLAAGAYDRLVRKPFEGLAPTHAILLTQNKDEAATDARGALEGELGFRAAGGKGDWVVMEKGLPYRYLVWAYYASMAVCLVGIALTLLFSFEQTITLTQDRPVAVEGPEGGGLRIVSGPFTARYTEIADGRAIGGLPTTLAASLGHERPAYETRDGRLYPVDWRLKLIVMKDGVIVSEKVTGPGDPLRHGGYAFYLHGLEQSFRVRVEDNPLTLTVSGNGELVIPGLGPGLGLPVRFSAFKTGTLEKADGTVERIAPHTRVRLSGDGGGGEELGRIAPGGSIYINGVRLTLIEVVERAVLARRYDPGFRLLQWGGILFLTALALRLLGFWQTAVYRVDCSGPIVKLHLHIASRGLFASSGRLFNRIERLMTANDIRPVPIAGERLKK